jgi:hypothetical protein
MTLASASNRTTPKTLRDAVRIVAFLNAAYFGT